MIKASASIFINAPVNKVFETAADGRQQLIWDAGNFSDFKELTPPPIRQGSKCQCRVKGMGKMSYEFAVYNPGLQFVHNSATRMAYGVHYFDFEEKNSSTLFTQTMQLNMRGLYVLLSPFIYFGLKKTLKRMNTALKNYIESQNNDINH